MEKNTVWAVILSTVVLVGFFALQTFLYPNKNQQTVSELASVESTSSENSVDAGISEEKNELYVSEENGFSVDSEEIEERTYTVLTNKAKITFTNRGGDVISYELLDHLDKDTGKGIEMVTNVSDKNRAFSLSLGNTDKSILNEIFQAYETEDSNHNKVISFAKRYSLKNVDGSKSEFILAKTYTFNPDDYVFKLDITVEGKDNFKGLNINDAAYSLRTSPQIGPYFNPKINRYENRQFISFNGEKAKKITLGTKQTKSLSKPWKWAALTGKYFEIIVNPVNADTMNENIVYSSEIEVGENTNAQLKFSRKPVSYAQSNDTYYIYVGPRNEKELNKYTLGINNSWKLEDTHFNESMQTSGILSWLEVALKFLLENINKVANNWGVSIIILTVLLRICMFPLTKKTLEGTQKMQKFQPKMQELQNKYKDNPAKLQQETAKMYKEIGYNPMSGCLPMLFQFVILFAMYNLFNNYFEFRGASFINGWIDDLSVGDHIGKPFENSLPFLGWNQIRILPVIYVISQLLFGKITQNGGTTVGQNGNQMKFMMYGMPLFFFFIFYNAPSGLLLYWTVSNMFQLGQQLVMNKMMGKKNRNFIK